MSVEQFDQIGGGVEFLGEHVPDTCFYCSKPLAGLTVYWHGTTGGVALHPDCGERLGARIIRDSLNAKLMNDGKPADAGVSPGLAVRVHSRTFGSGGNST